MLRELKGSPVLKGAKNVYFIHIYNQKMQEFLPDSAMANDFSKIRIFVESKMNEIKNFLLADLPTNDSGHIECFFDPNMKIKACEFLAEVKADLVVVAGSGHHRAEGVFSESYSEYLLRHAPCDVYVLKSKLEKAACP